jgi:hypothetical protein
MSRRLKMRSAAARPSCMELTTEVKTRMGWTRKPR